MTAAPSRPNPERFQGWPAYCLGLLALLALCVPGTSFAADPANVMIVFDASGSMWAKFKNEKQSKLALTRSALRDALPRLHKDTRVGLSAFGHRRTNDCTDFEVLERLAPLDPARIAAATDRLNPKGRTPLALAIKEAMEEFGGAARGGIVLIHDDPDNCQQDPCAAAAEGHKTNPGIAIHLVSVGMKPEEAQRLACVARVTGGKLYDAQTPIEVATAMSDALIAASSTAVPSPRPAVRDQQRTVKPGLHLTTVLSAGAKNLTYLCAGESRELATAMSSIRARTPRCLSLTCPAGATRSRRNGASSLPSRRSVWTCRQRNKSRWS